MLRILLHSLSTASLTLVFMYNYIDKPDFDMNRLISVAENTLRKENVGLRLPAFLGVV